MPIETRRGGWAMFYQARAMNALAVIAIIAENQGYNVWDYEHKGKNKHKMDFFQQFISENNCVFVNEIKEMLIEFNIKKCRF